MSSLGEEPLPHEFAEALAAAAGRLGLFTREILWYPAISSTNDVANVLADRGASEGTVVVANAQSAGRGRQGRAWQSAAGNLHLSVLLRPRGSAELWGKLPLLAGLAVAEAVGDEARLKWPNDVQIEGRKVAGVLVESASSGGALESAVVAAAVEEAGYELVS